MDIKTEPDEDYELVKPDLVDLNIISEIKNELTEPNEKKKDYVCSTCSERFTNETTLKIHEMFHDKKQYCFICKTTLVKDFHGHITNRHLNLVCQICDKVFVWKKSFVLHMKLHTGENVPFKCDRCDKSFRQRGSLSTHIRSTHEGLKPFSCLICNGTFTTSSSLKKHLRKMHVAVEKNADPGIFEECHICFKKFRDKKAKLDHEKRHTASKKCEDCGKTFSSGYSTSKHLMTHHFNTEKCEYCGKMFHKTLLEEHLLDAHAPIKCTNCNLVFYSKGAFIRHQLVHQENNRCNLCGKSLKGFNIERHMQLHRENKVQKCSICNKMISDIDNHKARVHKNTKYLFCSACPRKFRTQSENMCHYMRVHSKILRSCPICKSKEKFKDAATFEQHIERYHKLASYKCKICSKVFSSFQKLNEHEPKHVDAFTFVKAPNHSYQFKCETCGNRFKYNSPLQRHKCHFGTYHCQICDIKYTNRRYARRHMILKHSPRILVNEKAEEENGLLNDVHILKGPKKRYQCKKCLMVLTSSQSFRKHFCNSQRNGIYSYLKQKGFKVKANLIQKRLKCKECGFMSLNVRCMRSHEVRMHLMNKKNVEVTKDISKCETGNVPAVYVKVKNECPELKVEEEIVEIEMVKIAKTETGLFEPEKIYVKSEVIDDV